jgi:hypothetical protein
VSFQVFGFFECLAIAPALDSSKSWMTFSLSQRERAGVRENKP